MNNLHIWVTDHWINKIAQNHLQLIKLNFAYCSLLTCITTHVTEHVNIRILQYTITNEPGLIAALTMRPIFNLSAIRELPWPSRKRCCVNAVN